MARGGLGDRNLNTSRGQIPESQHSGITTGLGDTNLGAKKRLSREIHKALGANELTSSPAAHAIHKSLRVHGATPLLC